MGKDNYCSDVIYQAHYWNSVLKNLLRLCDICIFTALRFIQVRYFCIVWYTVMVNKDEYIVPYRIIWSWYNGRWWVGCYIWYSKQGIEQGSSPPRPLLSVPNVTAHPSTTSVPITVFLYNGPLLCSFNVLIKGLIFDATCMPPTVLWYSIDRRAAPCTQLLWCCLLVRRSNTCRHTVLRLSRQLVGQALRRLRLRRVSAVSAWLYDLSLS